MAWVAVDKDEEEVVFDRRPFRMDFFWTDSISNFPDTGIYIPKGSIKKLIGETLYGKTILWNLNKSSIVDDIPYGLSVFWK